MNNKSATYSYSLFSMAGLILFIFPVIILGPIFSIIYDVGWAAFCEQVSQLWPALYEKIAIQGFQFFYDIWPLLLIGLGMIYIFIERLLVVLFTRLTITDRSIIYKNPFNHIELPVHEIEGFEHYSKQRYILYTKDKKKKIYVDMMLNKSQELKAYLQEKFTKQP